MYKWCMSGTLALSEVRDAQLCSTYLKKKSNELHFLF